MLKYVPPSRLRHLPESLVTREQADRDKVHESDPDHIARGLMNKAIKEELRPSAPAGETVAKTARDLERGLRWHVDNGPLPLTPYIVDILRMKTIIGIARQIEKYTRMQVKDYDPEYEMRPKHLWFPENRASYMQLRDGPAPPDKRRPAWLKGIDLDIDLLRWPDRVVRMLEERGANPKPLLTKLRAMAARQRVGPWLNVATR